MADTGKTTRHSEALRAAVARAAGVPVVPSFYESGGSITAGVSEGIKNYQKTQEVKVEKMGGGAERTEAAYQEQRAGEREDMTQFGDDREKLGLAARSLGGSKPFTKTEVRRGYRKL